MRGTDNLDLEYDSPVVAEKLNQIGETVHDIVKESLETGVSTDIIATAWLKGFSMTDYGRIMREIEAKQHH